MFAKRIFLFFSLFSFTLIYSQTVKLYGDAIPGGLMIGSSTNIKSVTLDKKKLQVDSNGMFVFGFDRNAKGSHILKIFYKGKKSIIKKFKLPKRKYIVQKLRIDGKYVTPPKDELKKIKLESIEMKKARASVGLIDSAFYSSGFEYPVKNPRETSQFGSQRILNGVRKAPHNGIDFGEDEGTPVYAAADGIVAIAGNDFYYNGNFVLLDHGQGLTSVYLHFSKLDVVTGDHVKKGQKIGEVGTTGRSTSAHLHFGVQWYNKRIDPMSMLELKFP